MIWGKRPPWEQTKWLWVKETDTWKECYRAWVKNNDVWELVHGPGYQIIGAQNNALTSLLLHFNNSATDTSGAGQIMTPSGGVSYDASIKKFGSHSLHASATSYADATMNWSLRPHGDSFCADCWINISDMDRINTIFELGYAPTDGVCLDIGNTYGGLRTVINGNGYIAYDLATFEINTWHHVAATYEKSTQLLRMFMDGAMIYEGGVVLTVHDIAHVTTTQLRVGADNYNSATYYTDGYIDEFRFVRGSTCFNASFRTFDTAYNDNQWVAPYNGSPLLLHFDGSSGSTTFVDTRGRHAAVPINTAMLSTSEKKFGTASVDLTDMGYGTPAVSVEQEASYPDDFRFYGDFTIDCWAYHDGAVGAKGVIAYDDHVNIWTQGQLMFGYNYIFGDTYVLNWGSNCIADNKEEIYVSNPYVNANAWNHWAIVRNGVDVTLYCNGNATITYQSGAEYYVPYPIWIGYRYAFTEANYGYIDEVHINNGTAEWTSNFTPPASPWA